MYYPFEPLLFQSLGNSFILQCVDGLMVDGNNRGLSSRIFRYLLYVSIVYIIVCKGVYTAETVKIFLMATFVKLKEAQNCGAIFNLSLIFNFLLNL